MAIAMIYKTELEVAAKLAQFGIELSEALRIVKAVVTAHNDAVDFDPCTAAGLFRYIYGTRAIRETWCPLGWEIDRSHGIESVYDPETGTKIVYQNVDLACDDAQDPKAISNKGEASKHLIERSTSAYLYPEMEAEESAEIEKAKLRQNATTWYFCVSIEGDVVRAELSLPYSIASSNFERFIERIYIVSQGDWAGSGVVDIDIDDTALEFEPVVSKK